MQVDEFTAQPVGLAGDAMLATVVNHVASREGPVEAAELEMIYGMIESLRDRVSPQAMMLANAKLAAVRTAQEAALSATLPGATSLDGASPEPAVRFSQETVVADADDLLMIDAGMADAVLEAQETQHAPQQTPQQAREQAPDADAILQSAPEPEAEIIAWPVATAPARDEAAPCQEVASPEAAHEVSCAPANAPMPEISPEALAATCPPRMLVELARLSAPSDRLCNLIVARGHAEALVAILRNPAARFAKSSLTTIVELAASDISLREAMCARADLSDMILDRLWPYLSLASKAKVVAAGCASSLTEARLIWAGAAAEEADELASDPALTSVAQWRDRIIGGRAQLGHVLRALDQEGRIVDAAALLGSLADIAGHEALALMIGAYDRAGVALARAAGGDEDAVMSLIHLRGRAGARSTSDKRGPLHAFLKMTREEAQAILQRCFGGVDQASGARAAA